MKNIQLCVYIMYAYFIYVDPQVSVHGSMGLKQVNKYFLILILMQNTYIKKILCLVVIGKFVSNNWKW